MSDMIILHISVASKKKKKGRVEIYLFIFFKSEVMMYRDL